MVWCYQISMGQDPCGRVPASSRVSAWRNGRLSKWKKAVVSFQGKFWKYYYIMSYYCPILEKGWIELVYYYVFSILVIVCEFWHLEPLIYSFQGFLCFGVHRVPLHSVWVFVPFVSWFVSFVLISFNWFLFPDRFPSPDCPLCFCVYISSFHLFFVRSLFAHLASFFSLLKNLDPTVCFMF